MALLSVRYLLLCVVLLLPVVFSRAIADFSDEKEFTNRVNKNLGENREVAWKPIALHVSANVSQPIRLNCPLRHVCRIAREHLTNTKLCNITSSQIRWFRRSTSNLSLLERYPNKAMSDRARVKGRRLVIANLQEDDGGEFVCVEMANKTVLAVTTLTITPKLRQPHFTVEPAQAKMVTQGNSIKLLCKATGYPAPTVHWLKGFVPIVSTSQVRVSKTGTLRIKNALPSDTALYQCVADNGVSAPRVAKSEVFVIPN